MSEWIRKINNPTLRMMARALDQVLYVARLGLSFRSIGDNLLGFLKTVGGIAILLLQTLYHLPRPPYRVRALLEQGVVAGWNSIPLIAVTLGFMGMIVMLELEFQMTRVLNNVSLIPGVAGIMFFREFGATVVAAMLAAKVGAGYTAEIGGMKTTDQIDALELMGVSPVHYLVVPRFLAGMAMQVALSVIGLFSAFIMGYLSPNTLFHPPPHLPGYYYLFILGMCGSRFLLMVSVE
jgi:phospholipid/cholesterol/gamma-HCH transport system permease protein